MVSIIQCRHTTPPPSLTTRSSAQHSPITAPHRSLRTAQQQQTRENKRDKERQQQARAHRAAMTNGHSTTITTKSTSRASAAAPAVLTAMLAFNACSALAFQSTFLVPAPRAMHHATTFYSPAVPTTTLRYHTPRDLPSSNDFMEHFRRGRGLHRPRWNRFSPTIFGPSGGFQDRSQLQVGDPEVVETGDTYKLTFDLPADVDRDGLDVSVSGRLLTVKAQVTHEDSNADTRGGWVARSSRTDSVSRSFVLPEGVSSSSATASLTSEGKAEISFSKDVADGAGTAAAAAAEATDSSAGVKAPAPAGQNELTGRAGVAAEDRKSSSLSSSAEYLSSLSGVEPPTGPPAKHADDAAAPAAESASTGRPSRAARSASVFGSLDQGFGDFAKAMWGEDTLLFPTQAEVVERANAAREARTKRVMAMRRATMSTAVSQKEDGSYLVRVSLPEDATRDGVNLVITPKNTLRVSYAFEGRRPLFKDVSLPKDADLSQISAKFKAEQKERAGESGENYVAVGAVSGLEITVGKAAVPEPKHVRIE